MLLACVLSAACGSRDSGAGAPSGSAPPSSPAPGGAATPAGPPVPAVPAVSRWELDPENSSVSFVCKHVRSNVRGMFPQPSGTVLLDEDTPANSRITATIDPSRITTGVDERDQHLKGTDFFDVAAYPTITFVSSGVRRSSATSYAVDGTLTIHGLARPVTLAVTAPPPFEHAGGIRRGIEARTTVNRKDFGLAWEFPGEGPGVVVGDVIEVVIDAELVLQPG